jgi:predicted nucleic acid-binding protein
MREVSRKRRGPASAFLEGLPDDEELGISVFVLCELYSGAEQSLRPGDERKRIEEVCALLHVEAPDSDFAVTYGRLLGSISRKRQTISTMDLLIGTSAVLADCRLVNRNAKDFSKVPGLKSIGY